jgi:phosphotriesterase-related protein
MTVLGPIEPEQLGFTDMHEHILCDETWANPSASQAVLKKLEHVMDEPITLENLHLIRTHEVTNVNFMLEDEEVMAAEVMEYKNAGVSAILEVSPIGIRLDVAGVQRISEKTGVHIITSTGIFMADSLSELVPDVPRGDDLEDLMTKEIEEGIEDTGVKAGHIKYGLGDLTEKTVDDLRAIARVVNEKTGLSVSIHTGSGIGNDGRRIAKILSDQGMDLGRFIHCHSEKWVGDRDLQKLVLEPERWGLRLDYHRELLDQGVTLSFDTFGLTGMKDLGPVFPQDWKRLAAVVALIKEGYSSQIVLGTDTATKTQVRRYGGHGYAHLTKFVIPILRELGVSDYDIRQMTVENPRNLLAF